MSVYLGSDKLYELQSVQLEQEALDFLRVDEILPIPDNLDSNRKMRTSELLGQLAFLADFATETAEAHARPDLAEDYFQDAVVSFLESAKAYRPQNKVSLDEQAEKKIIRDQDASSYKYGRLPLFREIQLAILKSYEDEGLKPEKLANASGVRFYSDNEIKTIREDEAFNKEPATEEVLEEYPDLEAEEDFNKKIFSAKEIDLLKAMRQVLSPTFLEIVIKRLGLFGIEEVPASVIAREKGVKPQRVSKIEKMALERLRRSGTLRQLICP